ncbi:MAG: FAD-dependent oxidoreductase [Muribaculaceae bacterium]|nr:FAD-dependent oxidoreductase [Muribaculaceae bacterium]
MLMLAAMPWASATDIWVEAESFADKGGWVLDQQFMDLMGSPYIMAHGMGKPVDDAVTEIEVPEAGKYTVYVRTFNWTSPWKQGEGPGKFKVKVGGKTLKTTVGDHGDKWEWQRAGEVSLKAGRQKLALHDLTGFNGRCDAIVLTTDPAIVLPDGGDELLALRRSSLGLDTAVVRQGEYDLVVVGGGIAGMCAAVSAARGGMNVALVNDRPVLGGNNSSEVRVHLGGHVEMGPNEGLGRMIREFGHSRSGNAKPADFYEDAKKDSFILAEPGVTLFPCFRAMSVTTDGNRIKTVTIQNIENNSEVVLSAPLFSDCTGDGTIGYLAGADYLMGRESRGEFNEPLAPEVADSLTMGASVQWYTREDSKATRFPEFSYGLDFNDSNCERVTMGEWKWETGMNRDQITEAETVRDYGMMVIFSNWSHLKNHLADNARFRNRSLDWVAYIAGKRESRRLLGDYILKQDDIDKNVFHEDASFTTTWSLDLHFPDPDNSRKFPGREFKAATKHIFIHPYAVPYRCLYSRNIENLFMAGRNISVTHVALGTVRVMRTTGMMGEVVGMAAALCKKHDVSPREVYRSHLAELTAMMKAGAGRPDGELPDNQKFNLANKLLETPRMLKEDQK